MGVNSLVIVSVVASSLNLFGQIIDNPSFEGPQGSTSPSPWFACNSFSTPDTQPGSWGVTKAASDGNTFISLVTRADNTVEAIGAKLNGIAANRCYNVSLDLASSDELTFDNIYYTPVILKVWLASSQCQKSQLIWASPLVNHTNWQTYNFNFMVGNSGLNYLMLEVNYGGPTPYFGSMLLDNVKISESIVSIGNDTEVCKGEKIKLEVDNSWEAITWSNGKNDFSIEVENGKHWVEVQRGNCTLRDTIAITLTAPLILELGENRILCASQTTVLDAATGTGRYVWSTGSTESQVTVQEAGTYWVEITNTCETVRDEIEIYRRDECCEISAPNVFTPNGDVFNEYFQVSTQSNIARYDLQIFNRWGEMSYESNDITKPWSGKLKNGQLASTGVYYYNIKIMCIEDNKIFDNAFVGTIMLVK
jgi:gliding motility-associated-like protein